MNSKIAVNRTYSSPTETVVIMKEKTKIVIFILLGFCGDEGETSLRHDFGLAKREFLLHAIHEVTLLGLIWKLNWNLINVRRERELLLHAIHEINSLGLIFELKWKLIDFGERNNKFK